MAKETKEIKLLGFNFTRIDARKFNFQRNIGAKSDIKIDSIEKSRLDLLNEDALKFGFSFEINYGEVGDILIEGFMVLKLDSKAHKEVLSMWKDKKIPQGIRLVVLNIVLQKCSLKSLQLEEELGLPFHMRMPSFQPSPESEKSGKSKQK